MSEQAQVGDTVRVTHKGVVTKAGTVLAIDGYLMNSYHSTVEILSRATQPLPHVPFTYWLDIHANVWTVEWDCSLRCISRPQLINSAKNYAPFRQLVLTDV